MKTYWLIVGCNDGEIVPTWHYLLASHKEAQSAIARAPAGIEWEDPLPLVIDTPDVAIENIKANLRENA